MTSTQARHTRRAVLQAAVDAGARCASGVSGDPDLFFRADREPIGEWQARRAEAIRLCTGCPVRAACEELALRDGDGRASQDDMVRAGLTGPELAAVRTAHAVRLAAATAADRDTEQRELNDLVTQVQHEATSTLDRTVEGERIPPSRVQAEQNVLISLLTARIRELRSARRARNGWEVAA
ncbi:WhiB family transcriptional regulator [Streptomyces drozdowiczii]|uniref:WhiB family transcriptional regulator n=2 Tax=Streptomyces drozdowiczii TaxID=202862 RepID=A0ABY6Q247_9ACTN|nr:WhiB family transcriptional regulator [Streptomyces drozdowiczii]MCX0247956.1 WhiB family transcriptional regulator [Streptomyces drozdowiczii]UZK58216.1 WhiB family transcriptional regulator [Streptomyces drozdowiczii]